MILDSVLGETAGELRPAFVSMSVDRGKIGWKEALGGMVSHENISGEAFTMAKGRQLDSQGPKTP